MWVLVVMMCSVGAPDGASCKALTGPPNTLTPVFKTEGACNMVGVDAVDVLKERTGDKGYIISHRCVSFAELV